MGESILETEDGRHLLRWHTKYTRNGSTWKTNPMGRARADHHDKNVLRQEIQWQKITSKRDGETLINLGSSWNRDIAYLMAHDYVRIEVKKPQE